MMKFFIIMSMNISIMFMFMKHPLSMGLMLIFQTILTSMITGILINNFWFSYILLISMLSGMLVLFIYMASIASNEKFHPSIKMVSVTLVTTLMITWMMKTMTEILWPVVQNSLLTNSQVMSLTKLFNYNNMAITIMVISYLFITMIVISYIVNVFEGPLRTKN